MWRRTFLERFGRAVYGPSAQHRAECDCAEFYGDACIWPKCERTTTVSPCPVCTPGNPCPVHMRRATDEKVNHPQHYGGDTPYEVVKVLQHWLNYEEYIGFLKGNVIKYNARANNKGTESEDYQKACWYQTELVRFMKEGVIKQ